MRQPRLIRPMNKADSCGKNVSSLVLLAKCPGRTSFSSLFSVKHALGTKKVGHTGTLDSFAEGLLVVCTGALTRIASRITAFDKEYEAVIAFGSETDTLDPYGAAVRTAPLPSKESFVDAFNAFKGELMQKPPAFSALHVDGKRASDLARKGIEVDVPERKINVFSSHIKEIQEKDGLVEYAHVVFHVSKGTYIRSLARDIAGACGSAAHLIGLRRTKVGSFRLEDAAGYGLLEPFSIKTVRAGLLARAEQDDCLRQNVQNMQNTQYMQNDKNTDESQNDQYMQNVKYTQKDKNVKNTGKLQDIQTGENIKNSEKSQSVQNAQIGENTQIVKNAQNIQNEQIVQSEIIQKLRYMTPLLARECGFTPVFLKDGFSDHFFHGKPLSEKIFKDFPSDESDKSAPCDHHCSEYAVFVGTASEIGESCDFAGIVERSGRLLKYGFVIS